MGAQPVPRGVDLCQFGTTSKMVALAEKEVNVGREDPVFSTDQLVCDRQQKFSSSAEIQGSLGGAPPNPRPHDGTRHEKYHHHCAGIVVLVLTMVAALL